MAIATDRPMLNGRRSPATGSSPTRANPGARQRQLPLVVVGVLLVLGCALGFALTSIHLAGGTSVLEIVRPVPAGTPIAADDLGVVRATLPPGTKAISASDESAIVGQPTAVALVPGALMVPGEIGQAPATTAGYSEVAIGLKAGQYPPSLAPGNSVDVVPVPSANGTTSGASTPTSPIGATVLAVDTSPASSQDSVVVTLQVASKSADDVAVLGALGTGSIVVLPSSGSGS